jgi:hypothetical protein
MGEIIRKVGEFKFKDVKFEVEENESGNSESLVHIQSDEFRMEMPESEYIKISALLINANKKLKIK